MERLLPEETAAPFVRGSSSATFLRTSTYLVLALAVSGGAWLRFNPQIAAFLPSLAAPSGLVSGDAAVPAGLVDLAILPSSEAQAAVAGMGLEGGDAALMLQALREGRIRLVRTALVDASSPDDATATQSAPPTRAVIVSSGGYTTTVQLTHSPVPVTLPVTPAGELLFRTTAPDTLGIGMFTLSGPVRLPDLPPGGVLSFSVIPQ
jgi:hypothetical protein